MLLMVVILSRLFIVLCCTPIHEFSHALMANALGDSTAKNRGRLTINPFAHIDLIGAVMIFFFGIGYAKPVPVNMRNLKKPKRDMALISLAGPVSNLIMSFIFVFILCAFVKFTGVARGPIVQFLMFAANINVLLAVFNMIPIPPLDGSRLLTVILPDNIYYKLMQYERYIMIGLMVLLFTGVLSTPITLLSNLVFKIISFIPSLIFGVSFR